MAYKIYNENDDCIDCDFCITYCLQNAVSIIDGQHVIDPKKCIECKTCAVMCPMSIIALDE